MPYQRARLSLRFIVGDQHNTTRTTREPSFGSRNFGALTGGLAQRASQPSGGGSLTSNREGCTPSPRSALDGKPPLADDEAWLGMARFVLKVAPHQGKPQI